MNAFASAAHIAILALTATYLQGCEMCQLTMSCAAPTTVCAEKENDECKCTGNVTYGLKFADGKPGKGNITTFEQVNAKAFKTKTVNGSIVCSTGTMGGDPLPGYLKSCWCSPASVSVSDKLRKAAVSAKAHAHAAADKAKEMAGAAKEKAKALAEKAKAKAKELKAKAGNMTDAAKAKLGNLTDAAKAKASELGDAAKAKAAEAKAKVEEATGKAKDAETADKDAADIDAATKAFDTQSIGMGSANFFPIFVAGCGTGVLMMYIVSTIQRRNQGVSLSERALTLNPLE